LTKEKGFIRLTPDALEDNLVLGLVAGTARLHNL